MTPEFPWLSAIIAFPLIAALAIPVLPDTDGKNVRLYALGTGILEFCLIIYTFATQYDVQNPSLQLVERYSWIPPDRSKLVCGRRWFIDALGCINWICDDASNLCSVEYQDQAALVLWVDAGDVQCPDCGVSGARSADVFHAVGIGASSGLLDYFDLGWGSTLLRCDKVYFVYCPSIDLYPCLCSSIGVLWRYGDV